uniref:Hypervirulence associated protein TUDOR domain-containing protein n=1 Tax=Bionectria ochroleuca TaxID=29856 RepID=A0A0B7JNK6_BIOOC
MKNDSQVVQEFNELVNMTASELEKWLKSGDSNSAGWPKEDTSGESDPKKYNEDHIEHMRKVVSKRHLAQEEKTNKEKSAEEVKKTKSYASLKNWGHDFLKGKEDNKAEGEDAKDEDEDEEAKNEGDDEKGEEASEDEGDKHAGDKRKQPAKAQKGSQKKRETRQGEAVGHGKKSDKDNGADEDEDGEDVGDDDVQQQSNGKGAKKRAEDEREDEEEGDGGKNNQDDGGKKANGSGKSAKNGPDPGDTVSWKWGGGHPEGKVLDVKEEKATVKTKRGNEVSRKGSKEDPAVVLDAGKSKAVKAAHELD